MNNPIIVPMTPQEQEQEINRIKMAMRYRMFNDFGTSSIDSEIIDLSEDSFRKIACGFATVIDYAEAIDLAEEYIGRGKTVPPELYDNIYKTRENYVEHKEG